MFRCPFFWVDAFTMGPFTGNPAGVCPLPAWPADDLLQKIAHQNGLAETAFYVPEAAGRFRLRWFTPTVEIDLCGHATLASAHVLFAEQGYKQEEVTFTTKAGDLVVTQGAQDQLVLDFPSRPATPVPVADVPSPLLAALGLTADDIIWAGLARDWLLVLSDESRLVAVAPDFAAMSTLDTAAVILTAPGQEVDFLSRFFAPNFGVPEDPVTGSAHCTLIPYWAERLQSNRLTALQRSARGGKLWGERHGDRVTIGGYAKTYIAGSLVL